MVLKCIKKFNIGHNPLG